MVETKIQILQNIRSEIQADYTAGIVRAPASSIAAIRGLNRAIEWLIAKAQMEAKENGSK